MTEEAQEKIALNKQATLVEFFSKYSDLCNYVNTLPLHQQFKLNAITRLDEFMFWVREGIVNTPTISNEEAPPIPESKL